MAKQISIIKPHEGEGLGALREYVDKDVIGAQLKKDLLTKYIENGPKKGFYIGYREEYVGLLTQCYGTIALLLLLNSYEVKDKDFEEKDKEIIVRNVEFVLDHIQKHGYDMDPFIEDPKTNDIFARGTYRYTDSLSWVLSLITQTRYAFKKERLKISDDLNHKLAETARDILRFFIANVVNDKDNKDYKDNNDNKKDKKALGWGYVNGCEEPSIYFTYAATESFNDFEDYIMGNSEIPTFEDREFLDWINQGLIPGEKELQVTFLEIKKEIGLNLWDKYKDRLHTDFFSDNGMLITRDQIRNSTRTSALFYTIYVVCTLIYCETDKELVKKYGKDGEEQKERMMLLCKQAIQMVSSFYDVMKNEQLDNIVDKHILSFEQKHEDKKELSKIFSGASIYSSTLTPMLLKASGLLTFYITQFPEREMGRFLDMAIEKRVNNGAQWLWEDSKYDLATTERYIEAILDFYDYYDKYEKTYLKTKIEVSEERQKVMDEIRPEVEAQVEKDLKEKHQAALQAQKAAHETELQKRVSEFKIEALIDEKIEHAIQTRTQEVIKAALDEIISANKNTHGENIPILSVTFREVIMSYFYKYAYRVRNNGDSQNGEDFTDEELMDIFNEDAEKFVQSWFLYLLDNNKQGNGMRWLFNYTKGDSKFLKNPEKK